MGRPKLPETMVTVSVRLPAATVAEIDAYADKMRRSMPLVMLGRADAVRQLLGIALEHEKKDKPRRRGG